MKHRKASLILLAAISLVVSCAAAPPIDEDYAERVGAFDSVIELEFVTNRAIDTRFGSRYYTNDLGGLTGGTCAVGIEDSEDGDGELIGVSSSSVLQTLSKLDEPARRGVVVYVHGYYEDFERSCRRAATFKRRLGIDQAFVLFSWPANSTPLTYRDDVADLEASTPVFLEVLDEVGRRFGSQNVSIIGHSLGSRGLVQTLEQWPVSDEKFRNLVLVAADIDRDIFVESLPMLQSHIENVTVISSDRDLALKMSETVNRAPRLGQSDGVDFEGVTVIDVTDYENTHFSGHVYHLRSDAVVDVIRDVILTDGETEGP